MFHSSPSASLNIHSRSNDYSGQDFTELLIVIKDRKCFRLLPLSYDLHELPESQIAEKYLEGPWLHGMFDAFQRQVP